MISIVQTALLAILPVIIGGVIHMLVVKKNWLSFAQVPIQQSWFGKNKTWRGFLVMPAATILGFWLLTHLISITDPHYTIDFFRYSWWLSGLIIGLAYMLAELPNSFIKRRMGAAPGQLPEKHKTVFMLMDQLDSGLLCLAAYAVFWQMPWHTLLACLLLTPLIALGVKRILFQLRLKETAA